VQAPYYTHRMILLSNSCGCGDAVSHRKPSQSLNCTCAFATRHENDRPIDVPLNRHVQAGLASLFLGSPNADKGHSN